MTFQTVAIVIGISEYLQPDISSLPSAQSDAVHFARTMRNWGVPDTNIFLILNSDAKTQVIENLLTQLEEANEDFKLIFYFCGHGIRSLEKIPKSFLICHDSQIKEGKCSNAIGIDTLFHRINQLSSTENYIFIDACSLRINEITHPRLGEELAGKKNSLKSLFCLLSSGIDQSYEGEQFGYFTEALLSSLCIINRGDGSSTQLLKNIHKEMGKRSLPLPEMYNIGYPTISFLPQSEKSFLRSGLVYRHELIVKIQDTLIQNRNGIVCLVGGRGSGKSTVCQLLISEKLEGIYLTASDLSFYDLENCIQEITSACLYPLIILDDIEILTPKEIESIISMTENFQLSLLFASQHSLKNLLSEKFSNSLIDLILPPFTNEEGHLLVQAAGMDYDEKESEWIHLISQGNPGKIKKIISSELDKTDTSEFEKELKRSISAISSCGMYVDEWLFKTVFQLEEKSLSYLEEIGLIQSSPEGKTPHPLLLDLVSSEGMIIEHSKVLEYWYRQIAELPAHVGAAKNLLRTLNEFGYEKKADSFAKMAISSLLQYGVKYLPELIKSVDIFINQPQISEASLFLIEGLVERKEFAAAGKLLNKESNRHLSFHAAFCDAQRLWGMGLLEDSVFLCSEILRRVRKPSYLLKGYFYRGIAHFFQGNWEEALSDFSAVYENAQETYYVGRSQCMLGTINGIRGIEISAAIEQLKLGTRLLLEVEDLAGVWSGWNNLGEIYWKCGEYKLSLFYLEKALELSKRLDSEEAHSETLRNLLQMYLRWNGPFSIQVTDLLKRIQSCDLNLCDALGRAQIVNTLSTVFLMRRKVHQPFQLLKSIVSLTSRSKEYHIYTLANLAFLAKTIGLSEKSRFFFRKAVSLAEEGKNHLALHQIRNDLECIQDRSCQESPPHSTKRSRIIPQIE